MFGAIGIGALIGALGAKQRGGNLLKGALGGAALGGIGGMLGAKYGTGGGLFGFGKKMLPNALGLGAIGMGTEMLGQQEANQAALAGRRRMMDEEEERRLDRLRKIAGYDIADPKNFLTPDSYFGTNAARGGAIRRKYEMGGGVDNSGIMSVAENKPHPLTAFKDLYDRYITEGVPIAGEQEPLSFKDFFEIIQTKIPKAARGGRVHAASGMYLGDDGMYDKFLDNPMLTKAQRGEMMMGENDYNSMEKGPEGYQYDIEIDGDNYDYSFAERFTNDPEKKKKIMDMIMMEARLKQPTGRLLQSTIDTTADNQLIGGLGSGGEDRFNRQVELMEDRAMDFGRAVEDDPSFTKAQRGELMEMIASRTNPMVFRAQGGIADLDMRSGGESMGPGTGTSDDVPAMLSDGEFVVTAKAVENLGGGDRMMGARRMYQMMNSLDPNSQKPGEMNYVGRG